jgi:hypothetical protein
MGVQLNKGSLKGDKFHGILITYPQLASVLIFKFGLHNAPCLDSWLSLFSNVK